MNKVISKIKKYWWIALPVAFILGVGSLTGATQRGKDIISDPANAVTK